jgi:SERRATE/Ars2, N-terminal domain
MSVVDEFGRAIPSSYYGDDRPEGVNSRAPAELYQPLSAPRGPHERSEQSADHGRFRSGPSRGPFQQQQHFGGRPHGGGPPRNYQQQHHHQASRSQQHYQRNIGSYGAGDTTADRMDKHPSGRYLEEPMMCQYVWKSVFGETAIAEMEEQEEQAESDEVTKKRKGDPLEPADQEENNDKTLGEGESSENVADDDDQEKKKIAALEKAAYDTYRRKYCTHYMQQFFNKHLDDGWFRTMYSPAGVVQNFEKECQRAAEESKAMRIQAVGSASDAAREATIRFVLQSQLGNGLKNNVNTSTLLLAMPLSTPRSNPGTGPDEAAGPPAPVAVMNPVPASHNFADTSVLHIKDVPPFVTDEQLSSTLSDYYTPDAADGNDNIDWNLVVYSSTPCSSPGAPSDGGGRPDFRDFRRKSGGDRRRILYREAFVTCPALPEVITNILRNLDNEMKSPEDKETTNTADDAAVAHHVPRKSEGANADAAARKAQPPQPWFTVEVKCSDPYNRAHYDYDGFGAAPPDVNTDGTGEVPTRIAHVRVQNYTQLPTPSVTVLSASLSVSDRIESDQRAALSLARSLDAVKQIPEDCRLDAIIASIQEILEQAPSAASVEQSNASVSSDANEAALNMTALSDADTLDVAIAYLRRVHLLVFYHGCDLCTSGAADVWAGQHAASTIHLRLKNADEILLQQQQKDKAAATSEADSEAPEGVPDLLSELKKDLLVQRLDESISKALEQWTDPDAVLMKLKPAGAEDLSAISDAEVHVEERWLADHSLVDNDGRARCSFHFCGKLFKDASFLHKHLLKKHGSDYLKAEKAKVQDKFMMDAWETAENRPLPDILVDCGEKLGWKAVPVSGKVPMAIDPEPDLWKKAEEHRKMAEEEKRKRREFDRPHGNYSMGEPRPPRAPRFVDVDDMQDETLEVSFDTIEVALPPPAFISPTSKDAEPGESADASQSGKSDAVVVPKKKRRKLL